MRCLRLFLFAATAPWMAAATFVWNGSAGDGVFGNPSNWIGGSAPANDGTAVVVFGDVGAGTVLFSTQVNLGQIKFENPSGRSYVFSAAATGGLTLQGGIDSSASSGTNYFTASVGVQVAQNQTFNIVGGSVEFDGPVRGSGSITQSGQGNLKLVGSSLSWSGGLTSTAGTLTVGDSFSLGTGTLRLAGGTISLKRNSDAFLINPVVISANTTLTGSQDHFALFTGPVTLTDSVTLTATGAEGFVFTGSIQESGGPRQLIVSGLAPIVLSGPSQYTGGTRVANGSLVFGTSVSVPHLGAITSSSLGYIGVGFNDDVQTTLLNRLGGSSFEGIIGFDTLPGLNPQNFAEMIDLTNLTKYHSLASLSTGQLSGEVKVANGTDYRFGGGGGTLYVNSNLTARGENLQVISPLGQALTLVLRGTNTYKGDTNVLNSVLILDGKNTLSNKSALNLLGPGYVGYTENAGLTPNAFLGRINQISSADSIAGIDSANTGSPLIVSAPIDLSLGGTRKDPYYLGTSSDVTLTGTITPTVGDSLYLTAVKKGHLTVSSQLGANIPGLVVGQTNSFDGVGGTVELTNSNSFLGGTKVRGGTLLLSNSNALGLAGVSVERGATLDVSANINVSNALSLAGGSRLSGYGTLSSLGGTRIGNGAILSPGGPDRIGRLTFSSSLTFGSGGLLELDLFKSGGILNSDAITINQGGLNVDASSSSPFTINLNTLDGSFAGSATNGFDLTKPFAWQFANANTVTGFTSGEFTFDTSHFLNGSATGTFFVSQSGNSLMINFTPVPEPGTYALFGMGLSAVVVIELRRRRR